MVVVESAEVAAAGDLVLVRLVASHFLWKMVRRLVGALVRVGTGELSRGGVRAALVGAQRPGAGARHSAARRWTAPPSGLFLERVLYPGDPPLGPLQPAVPVSRWRCRRGQPGARRATRGGPISADQEPKQR